MLGNGFEKTMRLGILIALASVVVIAPLVGVIGALQASEALQLLAGHPAALAGRLAVLRRPPSRPAPPACSSLRS